MNATTNERRRAPPFPPRDQSKPGSDRRSKPLPKLEAPAYQRAGKIRGNVTLITGGDSGTRRALAELFAREGADEAISHLPAEATGAAETAKAIEAEGRRALTFARDVTGPSFAPRAVEPTAARLDTIDMLVDNVTYQHHQASPEQLTFKQRTIRARQTSMATSRG